MIAVLEISPGQFIPAPNEVSSLDGERRAPIATVLAPSWTDEERAEFGVFLVEPAIPPTGQTVIGSSFARIEGEVRQVFETEPRPVSGADVDAERDRRIVAGMTYGGVRYQTREGDRENVQGAATLAFAAMVTGAGTPGNLRWHEPDDDTDFAWIAENNDRTPMDAPTTFDFGRTMARHKSAHIFKGNDLKKMQPIPADYTDDSYWP